MKNCLRLNLNFSIFPADFKWPAPNPNGTHSRAFYTLADATPECRAWVEELGLDFHRILVFILPPYCTDEDIHIDGVGEGAMTYAINWNYNVTDFEMQWFKPLTEGKKMIIGNNDSKIYYYTFNEDEVELIETRTTLDPVLFNTRLPHRVINKGNTVRYGVTLRFKQQYESWEKTVEHFQKWIIPEELEQ